MGKITYIDDVHKYLAEDGRELVSVSAFTDRFKAKIDWKKKAKSSAARLTKEGTPTTAQQLLDKWENKRVKSAEIGTIYHTIRENELLDMESPIFYSTPCQTKPCIHEGELKFSIPIDKLENGVVYPELIIYDLDYMVCGQADKVIINGNSINIWDYKTDAEIKYKGYSTKWQSVEKLLKPLSHLDNCNANIYSIKMSLYMYLLWKANKGRLKPGELIIEHVHLERDKENDDIPILIDGKPVVKKIEQIKLPYRKKEVMAMLETLKIKA